MELADFPLNYVCIIFYNIIYYVEIYTEWDGTVLEKFVWGECS